MASITPIEDTDLISESNEVINTNFTNLNDDKIETSTLDTDVTLAADSDAKIATQRAVKSYVDTTSNNKPTLTEATSTAPTINTDTYGRYVLTTQVQDITSFTTNLTGTPSDGDTLDIRITNGITATSFVASSEYGDASSDSAVIAKPSGTADDDIMFMVIESGTAYTNALPDGWTSLAQTNSTDFYELAYKVASTEGSNYTVGFAAAQPVKVTIVTYTGGFNVTDPIDTFSNTAYVTSDTNNTAAAISTTYANSPLLFFGAVQGTSAVTQTKPILPNTDWTEDYDSGDTDSDFWLEVASMTLASAGSTGNITSTLSATKTNKHAFAVALKPVIGITWGASFTTYDATLPSVISRGETKDVYLEYNAVSSKWVTTGNFGILSPEVNTYTLSGIWNKPVADSTSRVFIQAWGAGGSGACIPQGSNIAEGGGGGEYTESWFILSELGTTETITVGVGGAAQAPNAVGEAGGNSTFGSLMTAHGGGGGAKSSGGAVIAASGGAPFALTGFYGVDSSETGFYSAATGGQSIYGGGGGGITGGAGGTSAYGGDGGASSVTDSVDGVTGVSPAGGGGGCRADTASSGAGGSGKIIVTVFK